MLCMGKHTVHSTQQPSDCKVNVILYGIDEQGCHIGRFKVQMKPDHIVDCKKINQPKSRPQPKFTACDGCK